MPPKLILEDTGEPCRGQRGISDDILVAKGERPIDLNRDRDAAAFELPRVIGPTGGAVSDARQ